MSYEKTYCEARVKPEMSSNFHMLYPVLLLDLVQWQIYIYRKCIYIYIPKAVGPPSQLSIDSLNTGTLNKFYCKI